MKFAFIAAEKGHSLKLLCFILQVSLSGFHAWRSRKPSARAVQDARIKKTMRTIHTGPRKAYGAPRMKEELKQSRGIDIGRRRTARLMREEGLQGTPKKRYVTTTLSNHDYTTPPNVLDRQFDVVHPNRVWAGDITYIHTQTGLCYLAIVMDLSSRRIVGWAIADHMQTELVLKAMRSAIKARLLEQGQLLFHSDQGSQYASFEFQSLLRKHAIRSSMSRRGNCWDNAPVESFFRSLKHEGLTQRPHNLADAELAVFEYIDAFYNTHRLHSSLGYRSPCRYEAAA